ncbi:hypothetical protein THIOKS11210013 [Thiocapsa sp. KS1]|nr:hypothetical protein THIOKS11210013 [Thiocapsa sp. KS1]
MDKLLAEFYWKSSDNMCAFRVL